jgi:hypothetical protein
MSISKVIDGLEFVLPVDSAQGAELARITLTELSKKLGYLDKDTLRQLAGRHSQEIAEFGETFTVKVSIKRGPVTCEIDEPTYNVEQAAYLALSSETSVGRASRVAIIKAHRALMDAYKAPATVSLAQQSLIAAQALVAIEQAQQEHERRLAAHSVELDTIRTTIESDRARADSELREIGELPAASVEVSQRSNGQLVVALLNSYAFAHGRKYRDAWRLLYQAVEERPETRIDLRTRLKNSKEKRATGEKEPRVSDIIDASGKSAEIYAIARQLFAKTVAA